LIDLLRNQIYRWIENLSFNGAREKSIKKNRSKQEIIRISRDTDECANQDIVRYAKVEGRSYGIHRARELQ